MRKLIGFLVFMNLILLGGGQYLNASTPKNFHHSFEQKHHIKSFVQDQSNSVIEEADLDLDDEYFGNTLKDVLSNKLFTENHSLLDQWYLTFSLQTIVNFYNHFEIFGSSCGQSNPIYITQQVLRI